MIVLDAKLAETPGGKLVAVPIPVAPVVVCFKLVSAVLMHTVEVEDCTPAVLIPATVTELEILLVHLAEAVAVAVNIVPPACALTVAVHAPPLTGVVPIRVVPPI